MRMFRILQFHLINEGDRSVGIQPYYEDLTITFKHGELESNKEEYINQFKTFLSELVDGTAIYHQNKKTCLYCNQKG